MDIRARNTDMPNDTIDTLAANISFKELKLRPGTLLQVQQIAEGVESSSEIEAQFVTALPGKGVMIAPCENAIELMVGEGYRVRGFTGQHDFSFSSCVLQNFKAPFPYALFVYPDCVLARLVRKAMRMKTHLPAQVRLSKGDHAMAVSLIDLSTAGAMITGSKAVGAPGDLLELDFSFALEGDQMSLLLSAKIAHSSKDGDAHRAGLMFVDLARNDKMALQCYVASLAE